MKKLSTIIALALVITIGGVFAAWHYSIGAVDSLSIKPGLQMSAVETSSEIAKGKIDQISMHNFTFRVDDTYDWKEQNSQTPDDSDKYLAMLTATGQWQIKFTPNENTSADIQDGIPLQAIITVGGNTEYDGKVLLFAKAGANTIDLGETLNVITITADQILNCLEFVEGVILDTPEKNAEFAEALADYTINVVISEKA